MLDYAMRQAIDKHGDSLGFTIEERKSRRIAALMITDLKFADDIALLSDRIAEAQILLNNVEKEAAEIGLHLNEKKTESFIPKIQPFFNTSTCYTLPRSYIWPTQEVCIQVSSVILTKCNPQILLRL